MAVGTEPSAPPARPVDVDTAFWLWVVALPLMVAGYVIDLVAADSRPDGLVIAISLVFVAVLAAVVATFLFLLRQGYRWARTLLTGGALASVVYSTMNLFTGQRAMPVEIGYSAAAIFGSVLLAGGVYLLHRKDAHEFFNR
ncbi:MAG: hypothetical protein VYB90_04825 [Actinomycetota bacterium]|nr:hypothetical protein [Actinomycetota bacterium]